MGLLEEGERREKKSKTKLNPSPGEEHQPGQIETDIDRIYYEVQKRKNIRLSRLAADLKVPDRKVEELARVLDDQGMAELHYPAVGGAMLSMINKDDKKRMKKGTRLLMFAVLCMILAAIAVYWLTRVVE